MLLNDYVELRNTFQVDSLKDYKNLICAFHEFSRDTSMFSIEEQNIILNLFYDVFERVCDSIQEKTFLPESSIDFKEPKTFSCHKINKPFNDIDEVAKTFISLRLLLPENKLYHRNLELLDFEKEKQ